MKKEVYLIDGSAYIYRAFHAVAPLTNSKGLQTNAVFGFINIFKKLFREKEPTHLAIAFDSRGKVFRHEMYSDYKANRPPMPEELAAQIPYIKQFVEASQIPFLEQQGVEADDLIASAVHVLKEQGYRVIIVSGDKDLLQLVDESVVMWDPMKDKLMDIPAVEEKYGVKPDQLLEMFALIGDSSDNVPGVPGVGPKTALKLIGEHSSLDGLYDAIDSMKASKMKEKIIANREQAYLSKELIRLKYDVELSSEIETYQIKEPDQKELETLYKDLEFSSFLGELDTATAIPTDGFYLIQKQDELQQLVDELLTRELVALDTETTSLDGLSAQLVGISLCSELDKAYYIPIGHKNDQGERLDEQLDEELVKTILKPLLVASDVIKLGHNLKYDFTVIKQQWGLSLGGGLADTMVAAHLLELPGRSLKLDELCLAQGFQLTSFKDVVQGDKREDSFAYVPLDKGCNYSCEDVYGALYLWNSYLPQLQEKELLPLFEDVEMPLLPILAGMEMSGICLDNTILEELAVEFAEKLTEIEQQVFQLAGQEFNLNSPKQLGQILFEEMGLPHGRKTKTGYSTDVKVLEKLAPKHEIAALILEYRTLAKLQSTYVEKLATLLNTTTGRVHTSFNQAVTATGRLSSTNPNLQNIPVRNQEGNRIRKAFVPATGQLFLSADYSQIDLRVLAHYSQDKALLDAFNGDGDIHARTAAQVFGVSALLVTPEMRRVAKTINFGIVYGMSSFGLSSRLNITRKSAQTFIDRYFEHYAGVKQFMNQIVEEARSNGYVSTMLGRRRHLPEIDVKNKMRREFAERTAINTPIQGTAADIIKLAMLKVDRVIKDEQIPATLLLQIHDELVFEIPEECADDAVPVIREAMESALQLDVPLVVNVDIGKSLAK